MAQPKSAYIPNEVLEESRRRMAERQNQLNQFISQNVYQPNERVQLRARQIGRSFQEIDNDTFVIPARHEFKMRAVHGAFDNCQVCGRACPVSPEDYEHVDGYGDKLVSLLLCSEHCSKAWSKYSSHKLGPAVAGYIPPAPKRYPSFKTIT